MEDQRAQNIETVSLFAGMLLMIAAASVNAATFTVTNTNDTGAGSFRQAVTDSNAATTADTIMFDAAVFSSPQTITLASAPTINTTATAGDALTITGPGRAPWK